jgi:beta-lactamase class D
VVAVHGPEKNSTSAGAEDVSRPLERPELRVHFEAERVSGTIALLDSSGGAISCSDVAKCEKRYLPASTFKIPNSMIALELGVLQDPESPLPWDGQHYSNEEWNRDHTLRTAIQVSCVPCFQRVAREIGEARMSEWVKRLGYGNADISGGVDQFWLKGGLRISPVEQVDFLRRFAAGELPIGSRTADFVRDIITVDVGRGHVLLGKTGRAMPPESDIEIGWFVGWVEHGERRMVFATLIDGHEAEVDVNRARRAVTERVLRALGLLQ